MTRPALTIVDTDQGLPTGTTLPYKPSALDCIGAIVGASGNLDLAAERMFGPRDPRGGTDPKAHLIATIAEDPTAFDELQKQLRVLTLLDTFQKTQTIAHIVEGTLDKQDPAVIAKLYTQMLAVVTTLTDDHTQNINSQSTSVNLSITDKVMRSLPPEIRESIKIIQQNLSPTTNNTEPEIQQIRSDEWSGANPPPNIATDDNED